MGSSPASPPVPSGGQGELELHPGKENPVQLCRPDLEAARHVSVAFAGTYQHEFSPIGYNILKPRTNL